MTLPNEWGRGSNLSWTSLPFSFLFALIFSPFIFICVCAQHCPSPSVEHNAFQSLGPFMCKAAQFCVIYLNYMKCVHNVNKMIFMFRKKRDRTFAICFWSIQAATNCNNVSGAHQWILLWKRLKHWVIKLILILYKVFSKR